MLNDVTFYNKLSTNEEEDVESDNLSILNKFEVEYARDEESDGEVTEHEEASEEIYYCTKHNNYVQKSVVD